MAGQKLKTQVLDALRARAIAWQPDSAPDVLGYAVDWIASGKPIARLAAGLSADLGCPVSRSFVSTILHRLTPDAGERIDAARREAASALVEEAAEIADAVEPSGVAVQKARLQVETRHWMAGRFHPDQFGPKGGPTVNVNIGTLMLDALRQPPPPPPALATLQPAALPSGSQVGEYVEAEVLS